MKVKGCYYYYYYYYYYRVNGGVMLMSQIVDGGVTACIV